MVPAVNQSQLGLLRVHSFLGYTNLILKERSEDVTLNIIILLAKKPTEEIANLFYFLLTAFACAAVGFGVLNRKVIQGLRSLSSTLLLPISYRKES